MSPPSRSSASTYRSHGKVLSTFQLLLREARGCSEQERVRPPLSKLVCCRPEHRLRSEDRPFRPPTHMLTSDSTVLREFVNPSTWSGMLFYGIVLLAGAY